MIKFLRIFCFIIFLLFIITIFIGQKYTKHINYEQFITSTKYFSVPIKEVHRNFKKLKEVLVDDNKIDNINELIDETDYVLKVSMDDNPILYGNGIINHLKVLDVIKGNNISIGDHIKVYDLILNFMGDYINYYGGMTPLNKEYEYIIFIKKAPNPSIKNSYIFSSVKYGHFNISNLEDNVLKNYEQGTFLVKDISKYDYVETKCESSGYSSCDSYSQNYSKMKKELLEYLDIK